MRWIVLPAAVALLGLSCAKPQAPVSAPPPPADTATREPRTKSAGLEQGGTAAFGKPELCKLMDGVADGILADLRATAARPDLTPEEARAAILRAAPQGIGPIVSATARTQGLDATTVRAYVSAHPDEAQQCFDHFVARLPEAKGDFDRLVSIAKKGQAAAPIAWRDDVQAALREAAKAGRPALLRFHAAWDAADGELDRTTFADPGVAADLERFVVVHVDATDDDATATRSAKHEYRVTGLPTLILFDGRGREVRRINEYIAPAPLRSALAEVKGGSASK